MNHHHYVYQHSSQHHHNSNINQSFSHQSNNHSLRKRISSYSSKRNTLLSSMAHMFAGHFYVSLIFLIVNLIVFVNCDSHCPSMCDCLWKGGKQTAECAGQTLMAIPLNVSPSSQVINLSRNKFQSLPGKVFQDRGLINLQKIYLSECELGRIAPDAFIQLTNLIELDLGTNVLTSVPSQSLQHTPSLRRLNLHHNPIQAILKDSFSNLKNLHFLDLSDCQIESIDVSSFKDLKSLEQLKLDGNRLSTLPAGLFKGIQLASIGLHRNPWKCDCELRPTIEWLNKVRLVPNLWPTCASPIKLNGAMWNSMEIASYACPPVFKVRETEMKAPLGTNLSLVCIVKSTPQARIFWSYEEPIDSNNSTTAMIFDNSKYSIMEDPTIGSDSMRSILTIHDLDTVDSKRNYICSAENQAAVTSKNFTISLYSSMSALTWSKVEIAGTIIAFLLGSIIALVLITVCFLRWRKDPNNSNTSGTDKSGLPSIDVLKSIKSIGRSIQSSPEHKVINDSSLKQSKTDIGSSSGYGSNGVTPDITSNVIKSMDFKPMCPPIDYYPGLLQINNPMCKSASYEMKGDLNNVHLPIDDSNMHRPVHPSTTVNNYANYENQDALAYNYNLNFHDSIGYTHFDTPYYYYNNSVGKKDSAPPFSTTTAAQQATIGNSYTNINNINAGGGGGTVSMIEDGSNSVHCLEKHDQAGLTNASPMHQPIHEANLINLHHVNVVGQGSYCNISHPTIVRYSPDEGYAEEQANPSFVLEGTEV